MVGHIFFLTFFSHAIFFFQTLFLRHCPISNLFFGGIFISVFKTYVKNCIPLHGNNAHDLNVNNPPLHFLAHFHFHCNISLDMFVYKHFYNLKINPTSGSVVIIIVNTKHMLCIVYTVGKTSSLNSGDLFTFVHFRVTTVVYNRYCVFRCFPFKLKTKPNKLLRIQPWNKRINESVFLYFRYLD